MAHKPPRAAPIIRSLGCPLQRPYRRVGERHQAESYQPSVPSQFHEGRGRSLGTSSGEAHR